MKLLDDYVPFQDVAKILEKTRNEKGSDSKVKRLSSLMEQCRKFLKQLHGTLDSNNDSIYPVVRLMMPDLDKKRPPFGFKSHSLARILIDVIGIDKQSVDGKRLLNYKEPTIVGELAGDLASVIHNILECRFSSLTKKKSPLVSEVNASLDELAAITADPDASQASRSNNEKRKILLQKLFQQLTPLEGKWLVRILLKKVNLGFKSSSKIFDSFHPKAKELYERVGDLQVVCERLTDPNGSAAGSGQVQIFCPCRPMLCARLSMLDDELMVNSNEDSSSSKSKKEDLISLPPTPFYVEIKFDGERFQIHYKNGEFRYFSRTGKSYTDVFSVAMSPKLVPQLKTGITSFIVDGEMMCWHKVHNSFVKKGAKFDVKKLHPSDPNHTPAFMMYDLIYLNDESMISLPYEQRMKSLERVFHTKIGVIYLSQRTKVLSDGSKRVMELLNDAIDDEEEGLIIKEIDSIYLPAERKPCWLKVKPEYYEGTSMSDIDLLVLGAYFGEGARTNRNISHFLVGVIDNLPNQKTKFYGLCRVGSGRLKMNQMKSFINKLWHKFKPTVTADISYKGWRKPDFLIEPQHSQVVQIKASELLENTSHDLNCSLRFPRIVKIRDDKRWDECMTVTELKSLKASCGGRRQLAKRNDGKPLKRSAAQISRLNTSDYESDDEDISRLRTRLQTTPKKNITSPTPQNLTCDDLNMPTSSASSSASSSPFGKKRTQKDGCETPKKSAFFNSKVFCIYGPKEWKTKLEHDIRQHGGEIVQNPVKELFSIVAHSKTHPRVSGAIRLGKYNVLHNGWIQQCITDKKLHHLKPSDFLFYTKEMGESFQERFDIYGDSHTKLMNVWEMRSFISKLIEDYPSAINGDIDTSETIKELHKIDKKLERSYFFKGNVIAFRDGVCQILASKVKFYGGIVANTEKDEHVTHIVAPCSSPLKNPNPSAILVNQKWLVDCFARRQYLDEFPYIL